MKVSAEFRPIEGHNYIGIASITIDRGLIINDIRVYPNDEDIRLTFPVNEKTKQKRKKNIVVKNSDTWYLIKAAVIHAMLSQEKNCSSKGQLEGDSL